MFNESSEENSTQEPPAGQDTGTSLETAESAQEPPTEAPDKSKSRSAKSLVLVNTGDGKGKSSAAFGVMIRAVGRGWKVACFQFVKSGNWKVGEEKIGRDLGVEWHCVGDGFSWDSEDLEKDKELARNGWADAKAAIDSGDFDLVILDEITYLMNWAWIDADSVLDTLKNRPEHVNIVATGRDASDELIAVADTVTEMLKVKHAFDTGIRAKKGIDF